MKDLLHLIEQAKIEGHILNVERVLNLNKNKEKDLEKQRIKLEKQKLKDEKQARKWLDSLPELIKKELAAGNKAVYIGWCKELKSLTIGPHKIFFELAKELGFDPILNEYEQNEFEKEIDYYDEDRYCICIPIL